MTKSDLRSGMFGKSNDGDIFVVAGDKVVYENGLCDLISEADENLRWSERTWVAELYDALCYNQVKDGRAKLIWKRDEPKPVEETAEAEPVEDDTEPVKPANDGAITITEEQFFEAIKKANEEFMKIGEDVPGHEVVDVMMGVQNIAFGVLISNILFDNE